MHIKLEKFEGPLSLLLQLIEKEEMDITEISLAKIADQYVRYVRSSNQINPEEMADFLVVAAKLLLIKSKALLPYLYPEEEEEIAELEDQLRMYQEFVQAAKEIAQIIGKKKFMFAREFNRQAILANAKIFSPPKQINKNELFSVFKDIITRLRPVEKLEEDTLAEQIKIEDKIKSIHESLVSRLKSSFQRLVKDATSKTEVIVSFLALLELVKQRDVFVSQGGLFHDIEIKKSN